MKRHRYRDGTYISLGADVAYCCFTHKFAETGVRCLCRQTMLTMFITMHGTECAECNIHGGLFAHRRDVDQNKNSDKPW